jgi:hypothetical protein
MQQTTTGLSFPKSNGLVHKQSTLLCPSQTRAVREEKPLNPRLLAAFAVRHCIDETSFGIAYDLGCLCCI